MVEVGLRIRCAGIESAAEPVLPSGMLRVSDARRVILASSRDAGATSLDVSADALARVELDNGFVLWARADDLVRDYGRPVVARDGLSGWEFDTLAPRSGGAERGLLGLGIKALELFGIDVKAKAAHEIGAWTENRPLTDKTPGLYRLALDSDLALSRLADDEDIPAGHGPALVFLHGTASSCRGSFGKLWAADNSEGRRVRAALASIYADRVYALEHRSLTESPIANALSLARRVAGGAELHLVSHSRGGMIGELLCLSGCDGLTQTLTPERIAEYFAADRTIAEQIGLSPLDREGAAARDAAYAADRANLMALVSEIASRRFSVRRFVRAACPARGTTLASGRLDRWLSVLNFLGERIAGNGAASDILDFLLAVVKQRTDPRSLPGLEAMVPGSALTRLLQHPSLVTSADLSVIAGDIEGDSVWQKIKIVATDWFYGAEHDLVVNTASMTGGLRRAEGAARFLKDQGPEVNHFNYFRNPRTQRWLLAGLARGEGESAGFLPIAAAPSEAPRWRDALAGARDLAASRPLALLLPGTLGSHLKAAGAHVWLNYRALLLGGLKDISIDAADVEAFDLVGDFYGPLIEFLARSHRVEIFPYDWRHSVRDAAARLTERLETLLPRAEREGQPVHIVAHSMGGLVVRAMIADGGRGAALWARLRGLAGSRFLMLGTPNLGSYEAVRWLTGFNPTQAKLSLLDITQGVHQIIDLVRRFPGLLELLPFALEDADFADVDLWRRLRDALQAGWQTAEADDLRAARDTWQRLRGAAPDPDLMRYVAGSQPATVVGYELDELPLEFDGLRPGQKRIQFLASAAGDGTVSWFSGTLPGVPMWYVEDTAHDSLCVATQAFPAYLEILTTGSTRRLMQTPPGVRRGAATAGERFALAAAPPTDSIPPESSLHEFGFGGGLRSSASASRRPLPCITVSVRHGDLSYARFPVMVGHYLGDAIVSAEAALDWRLGGMLTQRRDLGLYPGRLDSHAVFIADGAQAKPAGAIVVGLGQVGELSPGQLEAGARAALTDYALQVARWPDARFGARGSPRRASVSCLLIGTGAGGFSIRDALDAMLRAAISANQRLADAEMDDEVTIDRIEFLEIYEDVAISACEALTSVIEDPGLAQAIRWRAQALEFGQAGLRRVCYDAAPPWWHRLQIAEEPDQGGRLRFSFATDRARAEETVATGQLSLAESFIRRASQSARSNPEAARTLFEMLLPLRLRELAPHQSDLVLLLDAGSARYPWELLEDRWSSNGRPLAVSVGMVRQLKTAEFRGRPAHALEASALVIGNPDLAGWQDFGDLPSARREAQRVAAVLSEGGFATRESIDEKADAILEYLHQRPWRVLHLAGHGEHDYPLSRATAEACAACGRPGAASERHISGMVIGRDAFLTPGDVEQMRWVPELVFINCCHLGKTGEPGRGGRDIDRGALAANLGLQFIRMGVRAVVAAGWAVDDTAAAVFAESFYTRLLAGDTFGEAARAARMATWLRSPGVNTWGAYQCYGDPAFRLRGEGGSRVMRASPYYSPSQLCAALDNLARALQAATQPARHFEADMNAVLDRVPAARRADWFARADVCAAIGLAWGDARNWSKAVEWLEKSLAAAQGDCPVRVVEQCANFRLRQAVADWLVQGQRAVSPPQIAALEALRLASVETIEKCILELDVLCQRAQTEERLNLLGGACKRLAMVETDGGKRAEALLNMAKYYRAGYELAQGHQSPGVYPFTSWATALNLARQIDPSLVAPDPAKTAAEAQQVRDALAIRNEEEPNFWDAAGLIDLDLVQLMTNMANGEAEDLAEQVPALVERYRAAMQRGASPREVASVIENLEFVAMLAKGSTATLAQRIREAL